MKPLVGLKIGGPSAESTKQVATDAEGNIYHVGSFLVQLSRPINKLNIRITSILGQVLFNANYRNTDAINLNINQPSVYLIDLFTEKGDFTTLKLLKNKYLNAYYKKEQA